MLNDYAEVRPLGANTYLVKNGETFFIRKKASAHLYALCQSLIGITCPNLPQIYEVYSYPDFAVVIREYVKGEPLSLILEREKTLPLTEAKRIVKGVCNALFLLHRKNIVHRDVNPNNIIVSDSSVTLIDFDISRSVKKDSPRDTFILGTAGYAAPEQFGFSQSDKRADIYALGVLANVMLTGHFPYEGIAKGAPGKAVRRAVSIDPGDRFSSVRDFCRAFTGATGENDPYPVRIFRAVPGFRSLTGWKMALASLFYAIYLPLIVLFFSWSCTDFLTALKMLFSEILIFAVPYYLLLLRKKTPLTVMLSALSFLSGSFLCSLLLSKIL